MRSVLHTFKVVAVTATVTSAAWLIAGAIYWPDDAPAQLGPTATAGTMAGEAPDPGVMPMGPRAGTVAGYDERRLIIPVSGGTPEQLVDTFTQARADGERRHDAIDIMAPPGTLVIAAAAGTVEKLFVSDAGGNTVYVRSPDQRTLFYYAHLQAYDPHLAEGRQLAAGDAIGTVGDSGNASPEAPHLHFAMFSMPPDAVWSATGAALNPFPSLMAGEY